MEITLERPPIPEAPWWIVEVVGKKKARFNCTRHLWSGPPRMRCRARGSFTPTQAPP
jgi:polyphosphate kinase 2 (PPK2 family)